MAKRIIWTSRTDQIFTRILEYYIERNGSKTYSRQLNRKIQSLITILSKQPFLGVKTDYLNIRVFINSDYKIFYQVSKDLLIIHLVWDCRQNPESLKIDVKI